ncbi:MAG: hypothetical protein ABL974_18715 [Prosthecobacter sp.]
MPSQPSAPARRSYLGWVVLLYLLLAGVWTWRLRPELEPITDTLRAPRLERLTRYLLKAPPETVQPILMSVALMPDERLALIDLWLQHPPSQQLRELTVQDTAMLKNAGSLRDALLLSWIGQDRPSSSIEAHLMITAAGDKIDDTLRLFLLERLASRAQREGDIESALSILERATDLPTSTWKTVSSYIQIARTLDQNSVALNTVTRWLKRHPADNPEAREIQTMLLLRNNRAEDALTQQLEALQAAPPSGRLPAADLDLALVAARAAGRSGKLVSWLERQLAAYPEHLLTPEKLLSEADLDPDYCHWLAEWAAIADRDLPAALAFDACLRLAATGQRSAFTRVCLLAESAKRLPEAQAFLNMALAQPALRVAVLELAQVDPLGQRVVAEALRRAPKDRDLHFAATLASVAQAQPGTATTHWLSYLRRFPADLTASRRLIQSHLSARQPQLALRVYESLDPQKLTPADLHQRDLISQL